MIFRYKILEVLSCNINFCFSQVGHFLIKMETNQDQLTGVMMSHQHELKNKKKKEYSCTQCNKVFITPSKLRIHTRTHKGDTSVNINGATQEINLLNVIIATKALSISLTSPYIRGSTQGRGLINVRIVIKVLPPHLS